MSELLKVHITAQRRMAQARQPVQPPQLRQIWKGPLLAGLCFGAAYGITLRLLSFNVAELIRFGPGFDVQVFPGTSLESLKLQFGDAAAEIKGDLELQELERQQAEAAKKRAEEAKQAELELKRAQELELKPDPQLPPPEPVTPQPAAAPVPAPVPAPAPTQLKPKPQPKPKPKAKPAAPVEAPVSAPVAPLPALQPPLAPPPEPPAPQL